jgi:hypothetical protein
LDGSAKTVLSCSCSLAQLTKNKRENNKSCEGTCIDSGPKMKCALLIQLRLEEMCFKTVALTKGTLAIPMAGISTCQHEPLPLFELLFAALNI